MLIILYDYKNCTWCTFFTTCDYSYNSLIIIFIIITSAIFLSNVCNFSPFLKKILNWKRVLMKITELKEILTRKVSCKKLNLLVHPFPGNHTHKSACFRYQYFFSLEKVIMNKKDYRQRWEEKSFHEVLPQLSFADTYDILVYSKFLVL